MFSDWRYFTSEVKYYDLVKYAGAGTNADDAPLSRADERAARALVDVLPRGTDPRIASAPAGLIVEFGERRLTASWVGEGHLRDIRRMLSDSSRPDIAIGRRLSPGAKQELSEAGVGWADETGAAEIAAGSVVVSRPGRPPPPKRTDRWAPAVLCIAEVLLCGADATVEATRAATGLSTGSCANALRFLAACGLLESDAARGRDSGRRIADRERLLDTYAQAAREAADRQICVTAGVTWQDPVAGLVKAGHDWDDAGISWAATGTVAAAVMAPLLTHVGQAEVYVNADTIAGLEAVAAAAALRAMPAGRLVLRPFPSRCAAGLSSAHDGLRTAPWPRVYADLLRAGVRGEDAAEHLREVCDE